MVKWKQIGTSIENVPFDVAPGVNVWAQKWRDVLGVNIDPRAKGVWSNTYGPYGIYEIDGPDGPVQFIAGEFSPGGWAFYHLITEE